MKLNFNIFFEDLYSIKGINKIHETFKKYLKDEFGIEYNVPINSTEIIELAQIIESFIAKLFFLEGEVECLKNIDVKLKILHECKRKFIQRGLPNEFLGDICAIESKLKILLNSNIIDDLDYAETVLSWLKDEDNCKKELELAKHYAKYMVDLDDDNKSTLFKLPKKMLYDNLIDVVKCGGNLVVSKLIHEREGFKLQGGEFSSKEAIDNANYCIFCHERGKDSCRKGIFNKVFEKEMSGCPLDQKISEMNYLKSKGFNIAALSVITLDNPMCAATGHRICNDCSKACIFQKQEPVNIPGIETNILDSVLKFPYGFEIYTLLTKWSPLSSSSTPKEFTGYNVLVSGMGPAGFTMAHYLLNEGHHVVGIDGNKIEPISEEISGLSNNGKRINFKPIKDIKEIYEDLDARIVAGFGGVSEYGITVRWNKNYLKLIRIMLERRTNFELYGGVRFGSNIDFKNLPSLNFHHTVLAIGAGSPKIPNIKNVLTRGVRFSSDFLMTLQLGGAFKKNSLTNLQVRMPIVVIGGGLTAIDVATEALEYYKVQVEKFSHRCAEVSLHNFSNISEENQIIMKEFLLHEEELRNAQSKLEYLKSLGGVKVMYYKNFEECNSYKQNHEEVREALKQGIEFIENMNPVEFISDKYGHLSSIGAVDNLGNKHIIPARSVIIATGTGKNTCIDLEFKDYLHKNPNCITLIGDVDPKYSGSVVRAMASAKDNYKSITESLLRYPIAQTHELNEADYSIKLGSRDAIHAQFKAQILEVKEIAKDIIEIIIKAPLATRNFEPGQFYKLQNYETEPGIAMMEPLALTGASVDKDRGIISLIVLDYGTSSKLCRYLKIGEYVSLMGPTGEETEIKPNENVLLLGGGLGNAVLFSIGAKMRSMGCKVSYIAGYKTVDSIFKAEAIESASDFLIWACEEKYFPANKLSVSFVGNIIEALKFHIDDIALPTIDRIVTIGSDRMMHALQGIFDTELKSKLKPTCKLIASINSPMQCMMKGVCAQCLQIHKCPNTGKETFVYSCKTQDQDLMSVDFKSLNDRLKQNNLSEIVSSLWFDACAKRTI